jgi:hypothetical protein
MKVRTFLKTSLAALLIASVGLVSAQDMNFGLSAEDAAYLAAASENTVAALGSSFQQDFTIDATIAGIPDSEDVVLHVDGSGPVVAADNADVPLNFAATLNVSANDGTTTTDTSLEIRLVDGIVYVQDPESGKWMGVSVADAMAQAENNPMVPNPTTFDPSELGLDEADLAALMELPNAEGFLSQTRDGETFTFTADIGALLKSAEWAKVSASLAPKLQQNPDTAQGAMVLAALPMLLSEGTIKVVQVVDPSLNAVTELSLLIDGAVNAGAMTGDASADPVTLSFNFTVKVSEIGGEFTVEAPEGAEMMEMPSN